MRDTHVSHVCDTHVSHVCDTRGPFKLWVICTVHATTIFILIFILDDFKKIAILKKGIGIESQKLYKQVKDQKSIETR